LSVWRPRIAKTTIAIFIISAAAMLLNEARLEMSRPTAADPQAGYIIAQTYRLSGQPHRMYLSRQDEIGRGLLVVLIVVSLGTHVWAAGLPFRGH
jgi:hypothetical protein